MLEPEGVFRAGDGDNPREEDSDGSTAPQSQLASFSRRSLSLRSTRLITRVAAPATKSAVKKAAARALMLPAATVCSKFSSRGKERSMLVIWFTSSVRTFSLRRRCPLSPDFVEIHPGARPRTHLRWRRIPEDRGCRESWIEVPELYDAGVGSLRSSDGPTPAPHHEQAVATGDELAIGLDRQCLFTDRHAHPWYASAHAHISAHDRDESLFGG